MRLMAPATQAAERRMTNSKPSLETKVTYSEGCEAMMEAGMKELLGRGVAYGLNLFGWREVDSSPLLGASPYVSHAFLSLCDYI